MFSFADTRTRRRPGLTPLIDVVFLLLVFFMLASQFGRDAALPLGGAGAAGDYTGPPRLITITPDMVLLNGVPSAPADLPDALVALTDTPADAVVLQPSGGADVQRLTDIVTLLAEAGFTGLILTGAEQ